MTPKKDTTYAIINNGEVIGIFKNNEYQGLHRSYEKQGLIPISDNAEYYLDGMELVRADDGCRFQLEEMRTPKTLIDNKV